MNILSYLHQKALTKEYYHTDIHEVIMGVKKKKDTYIVKLWKDSPITKNFIEKHLKEIKPNIKIKYEYDMQEEITYKKIEGEWVTDSNSQYNFYKIKCGKCGRTVVASEVWGHFTPEHFIYDCNCGCRYYVCLYLIEKHSKPIGYDSKKRIKTKNYIRGENSYILPERELIKPTNTFKDVSIKKFDIIEIIKNRTEKYNLPDKDIMLKIEEALNEDN